MVAVDPESPAGRAGVLVGDAIDTINGERPRDVIRYQLLVDEPDVSIDLVRGGRSLTVEVDKAEGQPLGVEVDAAVFDQVRTCDNHCSFCFIYQLPKGMRRSLYLKDDDYRLSFLYGNFTTLTRFTEADLERVVTEGLSPLYVSIHATDRDKRAELLRNRRGATSLRWLRALLDAEIEVHGQVVVCPGVNDGEVLADTLLGVLDRYPELASLAVVPLGISDHSNEPDMRAHTRFEAEAVVDLVEEWQSCYRRALGRSVVHAADEYYLLAERPFPPAEAYGDFAMYEDGIGMARAFQREFDQPEAGPDGRDRGRPDGRVGGFFEWVDGAPALGYRAPRIGPDRSCGAGVDAGVGSGAASGIGGSPVELRPTRRSARATDRGRQPVGIITGAYGARVLQPLIDGLGRDDVRLVPVDNRFFGGNIGVTGLLVGADISRHLAAEPVGHRYLLPDVCLSGGRFLDGASPEDLPRDVEVIATDGRALRAAVGVGGGS